VHTHARARGSSASGVEVEVGGALHRLQLLALLEFSSERKRMSVVVRQHGAIGCAGAGSSGGSGSRLWLLSKGADSVMLERLAGASAVGVHVHVPCVWPQCWPASRRVSLLLLLSTGAGAVGGAQQQQQQQQPLLAATSRDLAAMSSAGYRTLVVAGEYCGCAVCLPACLPDCLTVRRPLAHETRTAACTHLAPPRAPHCVMQ
jgi:magnesium-transporting ATPase (P-type)